jgi:putative transposase
MTTSKSGLDDYRFRWRNLPHWEIAGRTYFVTFRLAGSLPVQVVAEWRREHQRSLQAAKGLEAEQHGAGSGRAFRDRYACYDQWLDRACCGPRYLADERIARLVAEAVQFYSGKRYDLSAYVVMPNHVHLVIRPTEKPDSPLFWGLDEIMRSLKGYTGKKANELLHLGGEFWQREYFDHWVRDEEEWIYYVEYTHCNPVKAGLCTKPEDWCWSSASPPDVHL